MNNSNYYIAVDESGQPYIAHMQPSDRGTRGGRHKYMAKFENFFNNGKTFYAYTPEQVRQAINRGLKKAKSQLNFRAKQIKTRAGVAKRELNKAGQKAKDILGYDERERRNEALNLRNKGTDNARVQKARNQAFNRAQDEYSKTLLGRIEYLKSATKVASSNIKRHANDTLASIREKFNNSDAGKALKYGKAKATVETRAAAYHLKKHANDTLANIRDILSKAESQANFRGKQIATHAGVAERELNKAANNVKTGAANAASNIKTRANEIIKNATKGGDIKEQRDALLSAYKQASAGTHPDDRALAAALKKELNRVNKEYEKTWKYQAEMGKKKLETRAKSVF